MNSVTLLGRLGKDPEFKTISNGSDVCGFTVATSDKWRDRESGEMKEQTEWHNIVVWGKQAASCGKYLSKGKQVLVTGKLATRSWDDKEGNKRYVTEIKAFHVEFLGGAEKKPESNKPYSPTPSSDFDEQIIPF